MKKMTLVALATLFALPAYANQTYIAAELGKGSYSMSGNAAKHESFNDLDNVGFLNIKLGQMLNENVRYYGYLQHGGDTTSEVTYLDAKTKSNLKTYELGLGGDYLYHFTNQFYAIAGANLGMYKSHLKLDIEFPNKVNRTLLNKSNKGITTGANLGLGYTFTDHFGMEIGYRYTHFFGNDYSVELDKKYEMQFDASHMGYLNLNYKF
ncbi:outer membrane beta-barrel protein [Vibrio caribbeanicus]|uniref:outer membrane beta-barrel protein n=1 Tax=Vibrio caribbeanicus TaxID=701175 RepID=UPI0030DB3A99